MEKRISTASILCFTLFILCLMGEGIPRAQAYKNYTVGDSLGWFDKLAKPDVDYDSWVHGKIFSLGDFLFFNTDNNHSVIQTHNFTTYNSCDSQGDDNIEWSTVDPNSTVVLPVTIAIPLLKEGSTYFFSGDYDGEQCMNGQRFEINVTHGQGLPPSLRDNPDFASGPTTANPAPGPSDPDAGGDQSAPDTVVSSDFNHPKKVPDDSNSDEENDAKKSNGGSSMLIREKFLSILIGWFLVLLGIWFI